MPNNEIWPGRDDEMFYPLDARGSGRARPVRARRRSRGLFVLLVWMIVLSGAAGGAYLWVYLPKAQQLHFTAQLLEQATQSAASLKQRVAVLEEHKQEAIATQEKSGTPPVPAPAVVDVLQEMREKLTEALGPLADQRHLQLLPHEQGLAVHLLGEPHTSRRASAALSREQLSSATQVAERIASVFAGRTDTAMVVAFRCLPKHAKARDERVAWRQLRQLARAVDAPLASQKALRVVTAMGEPDWGWKVPSDDAQSPDHCLVLDVRSGS